MYIMSLSEAKRVTKRISLRMSINLNSKEGNFFLSEQNDNHRWKMSNTPYQTINRKKEVYSLILNFPLFIFPFPILHFPISHSPFSQNWFPLRKEGFCIWWTVPERTLSRLRVTAKASSYNISKLSHFQSDKQTKYKSGNIVWSKIKVSKPEL